MQNVGVDWMDGWIPLRLLIIVVFILPYVLPVAHIGIVIIITIVVDLTLLYILLVAHVEVVILP